MDEEKKWNKGSIIRVWLSNKWNNINTTIYADERGVAQIEKRKDDDYSPFFPKIDGKFISGE